MPVSLLFDEILLDPNMFVLAGATGGPEFANANMRSPNTGVSKVAVQRYDPQHVWSIDFADIATPAGINYFNQIWYGGFGSAYGLRVRMESDYFTTNEIIGAGDGSTEDFKLTKTYNRPGTTSHPYIRRIIKPVVSTNLYNLGVAGGSVNLYQPDGVTARVIEVPFAPKVNNVPLANGTFTINNTTGDLHINTAPAIGAVISCDFQFDTPMQFWTNSVQQRADIPVEIKGIPMIEILPATLGIV